MCVYIKIYKIYYNIYMCVFVCIKIYKIYIHILKYIKYEIYKM